MTTEQMRLQQQFGPQQMIASHPEVSEPLVSIIIPTYNCLQYLPIALRSIQKQGVAELEIVIMDDGSSDGSWDYLTLAAACDKRIRPVKLRNGGVVKARNHGLKMAKGQYIAFLDADDYWLSGKLARQLAFHRQQPEVTLSFSNYLHFNENNDYLGDCFEYWTYFSKILRKKDKREQGLQSATGYKTLGKQDMAIIFAENVIGTSCVMFNRQALGEMIYFDEALKSAEDWDFWLQAASRGPVAYTRSVDMAYLMRPNSETSKTWVRVVYMQKIMRRYLKPVMRSNPLVILQSLSGLLVCYAEHYRGAAAQKSSPAKRWLSSFKPWACHFLAWALAPSKRGFRAWLSDCKGLLPV